MAKGKNGYVGFYRKKRAEVHADTKYEAQQKLAALLGEAGTLRLNSPNWTANKSHT